MIAALAVINALGDIIDWRTGKIIAGARRPDGSGFANTMETLKRDLAEGKVDASLAISDPPFNSTNLVIVATNVSYTKTEMTKIAMMANCGAAAIAPYRTGNVAPGAVDAIPQPQPACVRLFRRREHFEGCLTVGNSSQSYASSALLAPVAVVGMLSAIAIPNFVKAAPPRSKMPASTISGRLMRPKINGRWKKAKKTATSAPQMI